MRPSLRSSDSQDNVQLNGNVDADRAESRRDMSPGLNL